jgi:SAM-dependent methyltransferase
MSYINSDFYDENYFENGVYSGKSGYNGYVWNNDFLEMATRLNEYFKPIKVLDIGCAKGFLVKAFTQLGVNAFGIEYSDYAFEKADSEIKDRITLGSITKRTIYRNKEFDLITCYDVLEHLTDEEVIFAISEIKRISNKIVTIKMPFEHYDWDLDKSHIGIQPKEIWIERFEKHGFKHFIPDYEDRPYAWNWSHRTLFFEKIEGGE